MKIIISPAKKMIVDNDSLVYRDLPKYIEKAERLKNTLREFKYDDLKNLLSCNDKIAELNYLRYRDMDLERNLTPAILAYEGIQYQYMSPRVFTYDEYEYIENNLRILSGFYGILKPFDGVVSYRLEMQAKLKTDYCTNLYNYWQDDIYKDLIEDNDVILNLASKEYSKAVEKYLTEDTKFITCTFGTLVKDKVKVKATEAKMARGEMVRYMAVNNIENIQDIKNFNGLEFKYNEELSTEDNYVFIK